MPYNPNFVPNLTPNDLITFKFEPGRNYYNAMNFLGSIPLAANQLDPIVAEKMGKEIIQIATEDLHGRKGHGKNIANPTGISATLSADIIGGNLVISAGGPDAPYAKWVELGSSRAPPHPYIEPAVNQVMGRADTKEEVSGSILAKARVMSRGNMPGISNITAGGAGGAGGLTGLIALGATTMTVFTMGISTMTML